MEKRDKRIFIYITFAIALFALVMHLELIGKLFNYVGGLFTPIIVGLVVAFILNVPVRGFENLFEKLFKNRKKKPSEKFIHSVSIVLSFLCVIFVIAVLCVLVIPKLAETLKSIFGIIEKSWPNWMAALSRYNIDTTNLKKWFSGFNWENILNKGTGYAINLIGSISSAASSAFSVVSIGITAVIIAFYTLADRNKLARQTKNILYAYTSDKFADRLIYIGTLIKNAYTKFFTTQCAEAFLLGIMIAVSFAVFRLPYAVLVGAVTAICALIPYIGAFISCALGVVLALMVSPQKAVLCLAVYLAVQFVETQFIYPRVVGSSVGLSPLWTLIAVLIGGKLFGLAGMIFFIPLVSVAYVLVKEDMTKRLQKKERIAADTPSDTYP